MARASHLRSGLHRFPSRNDAPDSRLHFLHPPRSRRLLCIHNSQGVEGRILRDDNEHRPLAQYFLRYLTVPLTIQRSWSVPTRASSPVSSPSFVIYLASLLPLAQLHLRPIDRLFLRPYLQLLDFYAMTAGDVFSEVSGFGAARFSTLFLIQWGEEVGADDGGER